MLTHQYCLIRKNDRLLAILFANNPIERGRVNKTLLYYIQELRIQPAKLLLVQSQSQQQKNGAEMLTVREVSINGHSNFRFVVFLAGYCSYTSTALQV